MKVNFLEEPGEVMSLERAIALGMIDLGAEVEMDGEAELFVNDAAGELR